jgi:putative oxidoreductase
MNNLLNGCRYLYALVIAGFGVQHFIYAGFVATIVPGWIPWHLFWTYLVGLALIMAAISIVIKKAARLACVLLGTMIFLFVVLIHLPLVMHNIYDGGKITNAFKDIGLGCCAFVLGSTLPK